MALLYENFVAASSKAFDTVEIERVIDTELLKVTSDHTRYDQGSITIFTKPLPKEVAANICANYKRAGWPRVDSRLARSQQDGDLTEFNFSRTATPTRSKV